MEIQKLESTAKRMVQNGRGLLAADESNNSCKKRFDAVGIESSPETRRQYRQILLTAAGGEQILSGVILYDETFWQQTDEGVDFRASLQQRGILPGIKVDTGLVDLPGFEGEKLTQGLDGLPERMQKYAEAGAFFAKWRAVIVISDGSAVDAVGDGVTPTDAAIDANAFVLARYARICQDNGMVPIIEPEILFDGNHSIERTEAVMAKTFSMLFDQLRYFRVYLPGMILKTSMVLPGKDSGTAIDHEDVASRTVKVLHQYVPAEVGGVVFLSGGQTPQDALVNLNKIKQKGPHPWGVTFSFSRALQDPVLKKWAQDTTKTDEPSQIFSQMLERAQQSTLGKFDESEKIDDFVSHSQDL